MRGALNCTHLVSNYVLRWFKQSRYSRGVYLLRKGRETLIVPPIHDNWMHGVDCHISM